jgi:hypothetical protein
MTRDQKLSFHWKQNLSVSWQNFLLQFTNELLYFYIMLLNISANSHYSSYILGCIFPSNFFINWANTFFASFLKWFCSNECVWKGFSGMRQFSISFSPISISLPIFSYNIFLFFQILSSLCHPICRVDRTYTVIIEKLTSIL